MQYIIYKITNTVNEKIYIGQTKNLKRRISGHKCKFNSNKRHPLYNAMRKYGWEKFSFEVLLVCEERDVDFYEIKLIQVYDTMKSGYNLEGGGNKNKIRPSHLFTGDKNGNYGKKASAKTLQALRKGREWGKTEQGRKVKSEIAKLLWNDPEYKEKMKNRKQKTPRTIKLMKNGEEILIENVSKYCKENKHAKHKLYELINGKINKYKDFTRFNA